MQADRMEDEEEFLTLGWQAVTGRGIMVLN